LKEYCEMIALYDKVLGGRFFGSIYIEQRQAIDSVCYAYSSVSWPCYRWAY